MTASDPVVRAREAMCTFGAVAPGSAQRLDAARRLREASEEIEQAAAADARWAGTTWNEIGALYGTTKQGAQQRFGRYLPKRPGAVGRAGMRTIAPRDPGHQQV